MNVRIIQAGAHIEATIANLGLFIRGNVSDNLSANVTIDVPHGIELPSFLDILLYDQMP